MRDIRRQQRDDSLLDDEGRLGDCGQLPPRQVTANSVWYLDEMVVKIRGQRMYMWRGLHRVGKAFDMLVQKRRNRLGAELLRNCSRAQGMFPNRTAPTVSLPPALH